jgi:hypothetical protein
MLKKETFHDKPIIEMLIDRQKSKRRSMPFFPFDGLPHADDLRETQSH